VFVRKLRQKLRQASPDWSYIHTHFGVGYRFAPDRDGGGQHEEPLAAPVTELDAGAAALDASAAGFDAALAS
jgi:hypothetical protein